MRIELWIASPPTCSVRTPRASLTATAPFCFFNSGRGSARGDRPQRLDDAAPHANIPVVEVDRRVAMAGNELQLLAEERQRPTFDPAVLVGGLAVAQAVAAPDGRHAGIDARSLEAG